jgi:hypothetical protein
MSYVKWGVLNSYVNFFEIPNFGIGIPFSWFFNSGIHKKNRPESLESKMELEFHFRWGSQKLEPKIGIPNQELDGGSIFDYGSGIGREDGSII